MAERPALAPVLREHDRAAAKRGMPSAAEARVAAHLRAHGERRRAVRSFRRRWWPAVTFAAGAALVFVLVGLGLRSDRALESTVASASPMLGEFSVHGEGCRPTTVGAHARLEGHCRLVGPHMAVQTWDVVELRPTSVPALLRGASLFDVDSIDVGDEPIRVEVSHGTIEVLGTRFTIEQWDGGGHVDLFEGRIRFVPHEGEAVEILPGQRHRWGQPDERLAATEPEPDPLSSTVAIVQPASESVESSTVAVEPSSSSGSKRRRSRRRGTSAESRRRPGAEEHALSVTDVIERAARLRAEGRYAEAIAVLRAAARKGHWDRRTAQVLSYELGEILSRHTSDIDGACAHWKRHLQRFEGGRYRTAIEAAQQRLACDAHGVDRP